MRKFIMHTVNYFIVNWNDYSTTAYDIITEDTI